MPPAGAGDQRDEGRDGRGGGVRPFVLILDGDDDLVSAWIEGHFFASDEFRQPLWTCERCRERHEAGGEEPPCDAPGGACNLAWGPPSPPEGWALAWELANAIGLVGWDVVSDLRALSLTPGEADALYHQIRIILGKLEWCRMEATRNAARTQDHGT